MRQIYFTSKGTPVKISHFPGWTRYKYKYLIDKFASSNIDGVPENLQIITCVDDDSVNYSRSPLIKQLEKNNIPFINAAEHKDVYPWVNNKKIKLIHEALQNVTSEYCLILDGIDVAINDSLSDIIDIYKTYGKKIIFNATPWAHPKVEIDIIDNREDLYGKYCFLNAGCCIGETKALQEFYADALKIFNETPETDEYWESEQYFVRKAFAEHMDTVWFDYECKLFQVWHKTEVELPVIDNETGNIVYKIDDSVDEDGQTGSRWKAKKKSETQDIAIGSVEQQNN